MAESLVLAILEKLTSITAAEVKLVVGVDDEVRRLTRNFWAIRAVIEDAESRQVKEKNVGDWLDKLKDVSYDMDDVLNEWSTSVRKLQIKEVESASKPMRMVCSLIPCYRFCSTNVVLRRDIALKIKELNRKLDVIATEKNVFNFGLKRGTIEFKRPVATSIIDDVSKIHGRDRDNDKLLMMLLNENSQAQAIPIISIVGMGGIGKTTLARLAFNNDKIKTHFDVKIWVCVSKPFDEIKIAKAILKSLRRYTSKLDELQTMLQEIKEFLTGQKFFLVLDDVWTEYPNDWEQLKGTLECGSQESRILVTTRMVNVANFIGTTNTNMVMLELLSDEESWLLFRKIAFFERTSEECKNLEDIGRKVIGKCKGLPLAIKILGRLLHLKSSIGEWQSVLDSEIWELEEVERGIFPSLLLSYYDLPSTLRKCFSYCAIFPKNYKIEKEKLIKLWMAQSYLKNERMKDMELMGEEYFENLAIRYFFHDFEINEFDGTIESCKMHDIVHNFAQFLTKNECFSAKINESRESRVQISYKKARHLMLEIESGDSLSMSIYNAKNLRSLVVECETISNMNLSKLLVEFTYLRRLELSNSGVTILPREIEKLIHLRYLDLSENKKLKQLPEELCELYNLQTLNLDDCEALEKLPEQIGKLINLRHLRNDRTCYKSIREMPKGLATLTCLRSLTEFGVCRNSGLEYLKDLNNLRGCLDLVRLGDVRNVGQLNKPNLISKTSLLSLRYFFRPRELIGIDEAVLEALLLQPPPNLERLEIWSYKGKTLSLNWMTSLTKLKFLKFLYCINWEEWLKGDEDIPIIMPSLNFLSIEDCEKLNSLPDHILQMPTLTRVEIIGCPILEKRYNKDTGVDRVKISHIPHIEI